MDTQRNAAKPRWLRRILLLFLAIVLLLAGNVAISRFGKPIPRVDRRSVLIDTVTFGKFTHEVRGVGRLAATDVIYVPARTDGRVRDIKILPGVNVEADSILIILDNPDLRLALSDAQSAVDAAKAKLKSQRAILENQLLSLESERARLLSESDQAAAEYEVSKILAQQKAGSQHQVRLNKIKAAGLKHQLNVVKNAYEVFQTSMEDQLAVHHEETVSAIAKRDHTQREIESLVVTSGIKGVLAQVSVEVGQQVSAGEDLAKVIDPKKLKAELRISEVQVRYIKQGQPAMIDTYNGIVRGFVTRIDPEVEGGTMTVEVTIEESLPESARAELSVTGIVIVDQRNDILSIGRPSGALPHTDYEVFRLSKDGKTAIRTPVKLGLSSTDRIQVTDGLKEGDQVILSNMDQFVDVLEIQID